MAGLQTDIFWQGDWVQLSRLSAKLDQGVIAAEVTADLAGSVPRYRAQFSVEQAEWNGAVFNLDGNFSTSGFGRAVLPNLRADGSFFAKMSTQGEVSASD